MRQGPKMRTAGSLPTYLQAPHPCGENGVVEQASCLLPGPSPRGWGKPVLARATAARNRTIPTRVGKTRGESVVMAGTRSTGPSPRGWGKHGQDLGRARRTDHPHAGGENAQRSRHAGALAGPSPRGWGERRHGCDAVTSIDGPSPRGWGELATQAKASRPRISDHPHAGGENVETLWTAARICMKSAGLKL